MHVNGVVISKVVKLAELYLAALYVRKYFFSCSMENEAENVGSCLNVITYH